MNGHHGFELAALWSLAMAIILAAVALAIMGTGDANSSHAAVIAGLAPCLPIVINAIRNFGQSRAMQSMVDQLGKSAPIASSASGKSDDPVHVQDDTA